MKNKLLIAAVFTVAAFSACKKTKTPNPVVPPVITAPTRAELTKDSIYLYAQQTYLWNVGMPTYTAFNPRQYSSNQAVLDAIKNLTGTNKPVGVVDKYSFIDEGGVATAISGVSGDYGFSVFYNNAATGDLRIKYVYPGSPAGTLGVTRGDRIIKINNRTDLVYTNADGSIRQSVADALNDAIFGNNPSVSLTILKQDGNTKDVVITRADYNINPVLLAKTFTLGAKKVGYIVFNSFTTNAKQKLVDAFTQFNTDGITEIIVDLRYNGGGSVQTAVDFTNLIAPASNNGKVMFTSYFNQTMQNGLADILKNQKFYGKGNDGITRLYSYFDYGFRPIVDDGNVEVFDKLGAVNGITRAYFLVTASTASASELLINNLKPIMDVRLIGRKTYGKPVGFFALHIDQLDLYIPQFETKNSINQGGYFNGMDVEAGASLTDDVTKDFGDPTETYLAYALNFAQKGNFTLSTFKLNQLSSRTSLSKMMEQNLVDELSQHEFKGMVEDRPRMKLRK